MAGVFHYAFPAPGRGKLSDPGPRKGSGIVDGKSIKDLIGIGAGDALYEMHVFIGAVKTIFADKIRGVNYERIAFPADS